MVLYDSASAKERYTGFFDKKYLDFPRIGIPDSIPQKAFCSFHFYFTVVVTMLCGLAGRLSREILCKQS